MIVTPLLLFHVVDLLTVARVGAILALLLFYSGPGLPLRRCLLHPLHHTHYQTLTQS